MNLGDFQAVQTEMEPKLAAFSDKINQNAKLFARIEKIDSTLKPLVAQRQLSALHRLEQTRIDPTEPIDPDERAARFSRD